MSKDVIHVNKEELTINILMFHLVRGHGGIRCQRTVTSCTSNKCL